jgi:hypothetical protein
VRSHVGHNQSLTNDRNPVGYEEGFRSFVDEVQAVAVRVGLETLVPRTEEAIRERNSKPTAGF